MRPRPATMMLLRAAILHAMLAWCLLWCPPPGFASDYESGIRQIAATLSKEAGKRKIRRVVIADFTDLDGTVTPIGRLLSEELSATLADGGTVEVVERQLLSQYLKQRNATGVSSLSRTDRGRLGATLGVGGIVIGSLAVLQDRIRLIVKLTDPGKGTILATARTSVPAAGLPIELPLAQQEHRSQPDPSPASSSATPESPPDGMLLVPAGPFIFGEGESKKTVSLPSFWIDQHEVTNGRYNQLRAIEFDAHKAHHPVTNVSWTQANLYCQAIGKRLPTEEEWEKAARGTDGRLYPWGETYEPAFVNAEGRLGGPATVGKFEDGRSPYGAYDMAGNVMEWTDSGDGQVKVFRGGSWASSAQDIRTTAKNSVAPAHRLADLGIRCARDGPR